MGHLVYRRLCKDLTAAFQYLKGHTGKMERESLSERTRDNGFKLNEGRFRLAGNFRFRRIS